MHQNARLTAARDVASEALSIDKDNFQALGMIRIQYILEDKSDVVSDFKHITGLPLSAPPVSILFRRYKMLDSEYFIYLEPIPKTSRCACTARCDASLSTCVHVALTPAAGAVKLIALRFAKCWGMRLFF
jgi:hypothetical protein